MPDIKNFNLSKKVQDILLSALKDFLIVDIYDWLKTERFRTGTDKIKVLVPALNIESSCFRKEEREWAEQLLQDINLEDALKIMDWIDKEKSS